MDLGHLLGEWMSRRGNRPGMCKCRAPLEPLPGAVAVLSCKALSQHNATTISMLQAREIAKSTARGEMMKVQDRAHRRAPELMRHSWAQEHGALQGSYT